MIRKSLSVLLGFVPQSIKVLCVPTSHNSLIPKQTIDLGVSDRQKLFITIGVVLVGAIIVFGPDLFRRIKHHSVNH